MMMSKNKPQEPAKDANGNVMFRLGVDGRVYNLHTELARIRHETMENMAVNMLIDELDSEMQRTDDMGHTLETYLRRKYSFRKVDNQ